MTDLLPLCCVNLPDVWMTSVGTAETKIQMVVNKGLNMLLSKEVIIIVFAVQKNLLLFIIDLSAPSGRDETSATLLDMSAKSEMHGLVLESD